MRGGVWVRMDALRHTAPMIGSLSRDLSIGRLEASGLMANAVAYFWDNKPKHGSLIPCSPDDLDHAVGVPGFARALENLGVIQTVKGGIRFVSPDSFVFERKSPLVAKEEVELFAPEEVLSTALVPVEPVDDPVVIEMPKKQTVKSPGRVWVFRKSQLEALKAKYPGMDVEASVHRFAGWYKMKDVSPRLDWTKTLDGWIHTDYARAGVGRVTQQQREDRKVETMAEAYTTKGAQEMAKLCDVRGAAIRKLEELQAKVGILSLPDRVRLASYKAGLVPGQEHTEAGAAIVRSVKEKFLLSGPGEAF